MRYLADAAKAIDDIIGHVDPSGTGIVTVDKGSDGIDVFVGILNKGLEIILIVAAIVVLVNFIRAGFDYIDSAGDAKKIQTAGQLITYSFIGLAIIVVAPLVAGILGQLVWGDWNRILQLKIN